MSAVRIMVGGDVCPNGGSEALLVEGKAEAVFGPLVTHFQEADFTVVNLECPLVAARSPIPKTGPNLSAVDACAPALRAAGIRAVSLANNHVLDHGRVGLESTLSACRQAGLETFGAGATLAEADLWLVKELQGLRIAFAGFCEREWCFAGPNRAGGAPLDVIRLCRLLRERRATYDLLIVLLHGGTEHLPLPSPRFQDTCRFLVEQGASAVICQHSHVAGAYEMYQGAPIVYGQGNLLAPRERKMHLMWHVGFLAQLDIEPVARRLELTRVPYVQCLGGHGIRRLTAEERGGFETDMYRLDHEVMSAELVSAAWTKHWRERREFYYLWLGGYYGLRRRLYEKLGMNPRKLPKTLQMVWLNFLRCDAHREALECLLEASCGWQIGGTAGPNS